MNIKRLLKAYLLTVIFIAIFIALLFSLKYLALSFPIFFEYVGKTMLILFLSSPFVSITYFILKRIETSKTK